VTRNTLIINLLNTLTPVTLADWKAIKKAINVMLDPMLATGATIVTNQDGYQYLDTLTDNQGRPLLQPDVQNPGGNKLFGKPIVIIPNTVLPTTGSTTKLAPLFIGNFVEAITMFERQGHQVASTNIGGTAFQKNRTEIRVIEREDVKLIDSAAVVYGQIDVTSVA
jgi:HK97 family phage major capsid protein